MAAKQGTILVVDDNRSILSALELLLGRHFARVATIPSPNRLMAAIDAEKPDVVLLDMNFSAGINSGNEGLFWMREIKRRDPSIRIVLFTAYADYDLAVRAIKEGATDFVVKPWDNLKLIATLRAALGRKPGEMRSVDTSRPPTEQTPPDAPENGEPAAGSGAFSTLEEMERSMIVAAMERCGGNLSSVAVQLGITRQTLYNKIKKYGI